MKKGIPKREKSFFIILKNLSNEQQLFVISLISNHEGLGTSL